MNIVESDGLGRRYGATWALRDCTLAIPEGHLVAVVGPNGAGKSTMLNIIVGLTAPTTGDVTVLGGAAVGSSAALDDIAFVAQDMPLYRQLSVADMVHLTRNLNRGFDDAYARRRLDELGISAKSKAGKLSGGQQSQLALTLALARRPRLLVLDEPTSRLDPLARHDFMATVMAAMADEGVSVLLSSHALAELERVADYLVLVTGGVVRLAGTVDGLAAQHRLMTGRVGQPTPAGWELIQSTEAGSQRHLLVRLGDSVEGSPDGWESRPVGVEELVLGYLRESATPAALAPVEVGQ
jgi:ABC-2 type transport system ATP-binding protein